MLLGQRHSTNGSCYYDHQAFTKTTRGDSPEGRAGVPVGGPGRLRQHFLLRLWWLSGALPAAEPSKWGHMGTAPRLSLRQVRRHRGWNPQDRRGREEPAHLPVEQLFWTRDVHTKRLCPHLQGLGMGPYVAKGVFAEIINLLGSGWALHPTGVFTVREGKGEGTEERVMGPCGQSSGR